MRWKNENNNENNNNNNRGDNTMYIPIELAEMVLFLVIYILICELLRRKVAWPGRHPVLTYLLVLLILGSSW